MRKYRTVTYSDPYQKDFKYILYWNAGDPTPLEEIKRLNDEGRNIAFLPLPMKRPKFIFKNSRKGWTGGLAHGYFRDIILDIDYPERKAGKAPKEAAMESLLSSTLHDLPKVLSRSVFKVFNTGGGLQVRIRFAKVLTQRQYAQLMRALPSALSHMPYVDRTCFAHNQAQRMPGTRNWKYEGGPMCREMTWRPPGHKPFKPLSFKKAVEVIEKPVKPTRRVRKHIQLCLDFAQGAVILARDVAAMVASWFMKKLRIDWNHLSENCDGRVVSNLSSVCGVSSFTMADIKGFSQFRFFGALKSAVLTTLSLRQLKSLKGIPAIIRNIEKSKRNTIYNNMSSKGDKAKDITIGYKLAKQVHGLIHSLPVKKKKHRGFTTSFDLVDLVMAGWIQDGRVPRDETYESAWKRVVLHLATLAGFVKEEESNETLEIELHKETEHTKSNEGTMETGDVDLFTLHRQDGRTKLVEPPTVLHSDANERGSKGCAGHQAQRLAKLEPSKISLEHVQESSNSNVDGEQTTKNAKSKEDAPCNSATFCVERWPE